MSIPRIIHFCWFGKGNYPDLVKKCIETWREKMPDYEIKIWNEETFDVNQYSFTKEAYQMRRWAFVSDVARLKALYDYGGVYLDTDVEVIKDFSNLLTDTNLVLGKVEGGLVCTSFIASEKANPFIKKIIDMYSANSFITNDNTTKELMNTLIFSYFLSKIYDCRVDYKPFKNQFVSIHTLDFFSPFRKNILGKESTKYSSKNYLVTDNTYTIHHDMGSWYHKGKLNIILRGLVRLLIPSFLYLHLKARKQRNALKNVEKVFVIPD